MTPTKSEQPKREVITVARFNELLAENEQLRASNRDLLLRAGNQILEAKRTAAAPAGPTGEADPAADTQPDPALSDKQRRSKALRDQFATISDPHKRGAFWLANKDSMLD
jgi:hypothetical protein